MSNTVLKSNGRHSQARRALIAIALLVPLVVSVIPDGSGAAARRVVRRLTSATFVGHGWGDGVGMGQWGDFGDAVRYHESYAEILSHFYGGTTLTTLGALGEQNEPEIRVLIMENLNSTSNVGYDPVVTATSSFTVASGTGPTTPPASPASTTSSTTSTSSTTTWTSTTTLPAATGNSGVVSTTSSTTSTTSTTTTTLPVSGSPLTVPAGDAVDLRLEADGTWSAYVANSCTSASAAASSATPVATGLVDPIVTPSVPVSSNVGLLTLCRHDGVDEPLRGSIEAYDRQGYERTINELPLDDYLDGVVPAEESASWGGDGGTAGAPQGEAWGFQALEAQAVAARSYALAYAAAGGWNGYADICDDTECQAYVGTTYETALSDLAVADTTGAVLTAPSVTSGAASVVSAQYSASTGGWTAGTPFASVRDRGDACVVPGVALECNPNHTWDATFTGAVLHRDFRSVGTLTHIRVIERNKHGSLGGRALEVRVTGTAGSIVVAGYTFASDLGLKSNWFAVAHTTSTPTSTTTTTTSSTTSTTTTFPLSSGPSGVTGATVASSSGT